MDTIRAIISIVRRVRKVCLTVATCTPGIKYTFGEGTRCSRRYWYRLYSPKIRNIRFIVSGNRKESGENESPGIEHRVFEARMSERSRVLVKFQCDCIAYRTHLTSNSRRQQTKEARARARARVRARDSRVCTNARGSGVPVHARYPSEA